MDISWVIEDYTPSCSSSGHLEVRAGQQVEILDLSPRAPFTGNQSLLETEDMCLVRVVNNGRKSSSRTPLGSISSSVPIINNIGQEGLVPASCLKFPTTKSNKYLTSTDSKSSSVDEGKKQKTSFLDYF